MRTSATNREVRASCSVRLRSRTGRLRCILRYLLSIHLTVLLATFAVVTKRRTTAAHAPLEGKAVAEATTSPL